MKIFAPLPGTQALFVACPVPEILFAGTRGAAKTFGLILKFLQHVGQGFGLFWHGIIFRRRFKQLADLVKKSRQIIPRVCPGSRFLSSGKDYKWVFPDGEELLFRHVSRIEEYDDYHGWGAPFVGFEEVTNWPTPDIYLKFKSINRGEMPGVPIFYGGTTNTYGPGLWWVKGRFKDKGKPGAIIRDEWGNPRTWLQGTIYENKPLLEADPRYLPELLADPNKARRRAWVGCDWNIDEGGMFTDLWNPDTKPIMFIEPFTLPSHWPITRSFDWGQSAPFSTGFFAWSDGTEATLANGEKYTWPRGSAFRVAEWYGWTGKPNEGLGLTNTEIAAGILARETRYDLKNILPGPADPMIFNKKPGENSIATTMENLGVKWIPADNSKGSRVNGWSLIRDMMHNTVEGEPDHPHLVVFNRCDQFDRTMSILQRDPLNPDEISDNQEDHIGDETRYALTAGAPKIYGAGMSPVGGR